MEVGGLLTYPLYMRIAVISGTNPWGWEQGMDVLWKARGRGRFNICPPLPSQNPLCPNYCELLHLLTFLLMQEEIYWEDLLLKKKKGKSKNLRFYIQIWI